MRRNKILWAVASIVVVLALAGVAIAVAERSRSGPGSPAPSGAPSASAATNAPANAPVTPPPGADITGPLDLLLIGVDTRVSIPDWQPHADALMLLHVDRGLKSGVLYSLPRDLRVQIPAFPKSGFPGGRHKITEAMSYGARVPGSKRANVRQGYELLVRAVSAYTGIKTFQAGAILTFGGLQHLVDALGGVTMRIDQRVASKHLQPDGKPRTLKPGGGDYVGPQAVYLPGVRKLVGWQALDYARQRYIPGGDYARQRHQRQMVKAILTEALGQNLATDQAKLTKVLGAIGKALVYVGGETPLAYAYALRNLTPASLTMVGLPGGAVTSGGQYLGEQLRPEGTAFLAAVAKGDPAAFLRTHPDLINRA